MDEVKFFQDDLVKLEGCIHEFNVKETIDKAG